tara:strand:- start:640 stop:1344 length:705 start_codon:yes stop_codon:yes gene_type:complete
MKTIREKIISVIKNNRISSVEVADALGKNGVIEGPKPLVSRKFVVGEVKYIYGHSRSNWSIHEQGEKVENGGVLYVDTFECFNQAAFGDIVAKYFILYKEFDGIIVNGLMRDIHVLIKQDYPVWALGVTPLGCYNKKIEPTQKIIKQAKINREKIEGAVMVADDSGCTLIKKDLLNEETLKKLEFIELQEDIWYYCLDTLKWSTYKTICEKAYLNDNDALPKHLRDMLKKYDLI